MMPQAIESSPFLAILFGISVYFFALLVAVMLLKLAAVQKNSTASVGRYGSIDGLRGLLAVGVFVHHSMAVFEYFRTGVWSWSDNSVLNQFGQTTVALFFMITGFLFALKSSRVKINWSHLYISRFARLAPLYIVVVLLVFLIVFQLSNWTIFESPFKILKELFLWLTFVVFGRPDVNLFPQTWTLIAGVNWSLKYEILFYVFAIPVLHLISRLFPEIWRLIIAIFMLAVVSLYRWYSGWTGEGALLYISHFLGGIVVAYSQFSLPLKELLSSKPFRVLALGCLVVLGMFINNYSALAIGLSTVVFAAVVGGASVFGVLDTRAAIWLGDISYGLYLIHGLVLWVVMRTVSVEIPLGEIGLIFYCFIVLASLICVIALASFSYVYLEKPAMSRVGGHG